ncbi:MAG: NYN domain-containing protein [Hyphomicrobium sp.]|uniref:LabA-like NYN domain-containing protein n=1 Tax=Hyphomicrobium sp. TaxID=82 RepID=UPI0039E36C7D
MSSYSERVAFFIDGPNLYAMGQGLGFEIDFKRLLALCKQNGQLIRALYYTALSNDQDYCAVRPLVDWLDFNGFTTVTKTAKEFSDGNGHRKIKGNMNIELAVDALSLAKNLDHIVIVSGDGSLRYLVEALQQMGKRVSVISTLETKPPMVADELRRQADRFIDLADLEKEIARTNAKKTR